MHGPFAKKLSKKVSAKDINPDKSGGLISVPYIRRTFKAI
jgi:hypothetical protein